MAQSGQTYRIERRERAGWRSDDLGESTGLDLATAEHMIEHGLPVLASSDAAWRGEYRIVDEDTGESVSAQMIGPEMHGPRARS